MQRPETVCERWRASLMEHYGGQPGPEHFLPQCDASGEFTPVQCYGETTYCWCVDKDGREVPGTRSHDRVKPACKCCSTKYILNKYFWKWRILFLLGFRIASRLLHVFSCLYFYWYFCSQNYLNYFWPYIIMYPVMFRHTNCAPAYHASIAPPRCDPSPFRHYFTVRSRPTDWSTSSQWHTYGQGEILGAPRLACKILTLSLHSLFMHTKYENSLQ